jgi:hypothetical protein
MFELTSCMAENADFFCHAVADYISDRLHFPIDVINDIPWQQREQLLDAGQIQVCWPASSIELFGS